MAKRRNKNRNSNSRKYQTRVARNTKRTRLHSDTFSNYKIDNRFVESRRAYNPTYIPSPLNFKPSRITVGSQTKGKYSKSSGETTPLPYRAPREKFADYRKVRVCVQRQQRKEILFALGRGGKNGMKKRKISERSTIKC